MYNTDDLYEILQVHDTAEPEVIQAAYRRLARKYHPDVYRSPDAEEIMKRLTLAYGVLSDPVKRSDYDRQRDVSKRKRTEEEERESRQRRARQQHAERERQEREKQEQADKEERQRRASQRRAQGDARTRRQTVATGKRWGWASAVGSLLTLVLLFVFIQRSPVDRPNTRSSVAVVPSPSSRSEDVFLPLRSGTSFRDCTGCPEMVVVAAGEFTMGAADGMTNARPVRDVRVARFALGRYEVTRNQYAAFLSATSYVVGGGCYVNDDQGNAIWDATASWRTPGFDQGGDHPVVCVSWRDAQAYVRWLSEGTGREYRLPSEAEWEYSARAGTRTRWYWGRSATLQCVLSNGGDRTLDLRLGNWRWAVAACQDDAAYSAPIGSYEPNAFGLSDMLGNVWEWTEDCWHENYRGAPRDGSAWTSGGDCRSRVLRGGSWQDSPRRLRSDLRNRYDAGRRSLSSVGFRVVRTIRTVAAYRRGMEIEQLPTASPKVVWNGG